MRAWLLLLALATPLRAQETVQPDLATGPQPNGPIPVTYPVREADRLQEGWVMLDFMIDPNGRTYEVVVVDSTGSKSFEAAAVKAAKRWTFEPARLQDKPIDTSYHFKLYFDHPYAQGVRKEFATEYETAVAAIAADQRTRSQASLARMVAQNLEEDAFASLAQYQFEAKWGTEAKQISALRRAIAEETTPRFLPSEQFAAALQALLPLELKTLDFAKAMATWDTLKKSKLAEASIASWQPKIDDATALRSDDRSYAVPGEIAAGSSSWFYSLYKRRFQVTVSSGHLSEVKLRCDRQYVSFSFDPTSSYRIADQYGNCRLELIGDAGTRFELTQS